MKKEELENYEPKGELTGFPKEIIARMLQCQEEQGNKRDIYLFERNRSAGFIWNKTKEKDVFWFKVIREKNFDLFFEKYPKQDSQDHSQEFKVGDKVIDIISGRRGRVIQIHAPNNNSFSIFVDFNNDEGLYFTLNGMYYDTDKHPRLLHYRDDYNYDVIDFNNLPKRQEPKKWRAKKGQRYYYIDSYFDVDMSFDVDSFIEGYSNIDTKFYNSGNYFRTEVEAEIIAQKLNTHFKQLIKE